MYVDLYSAFHDNHLVLKALRHGSHSLTCKQHHACSSRGGECTSLLGPGEPYTPNSEKDTSCLGPVEPYAPPMSKYDHIDKKGESPWDGPPPSPAQLTWHA